MNQISKVLKVDPRKILTEKDIYIKLDYRNEKEKSPSMMLIVGHNPHYDYFIIKNTFGNHFCDQGYFKIKKNIFGKMGYLSPYVSYEKLHRIYLANW